MSTEALRAAPEAAGVPLRRRPAFRRLWAAQSVSALGDEITLLALPLTAVLTLDASARQMGLLTAAGLAPHLLFSLVAGAWVDRRRHRRRLMIAADLGRAAVLASVPVAAALDALTLGQLYAAAFAAGTLAVLFDIGYASLVVVVVPREQVVEANSKFSLSRSGAFIGGPAIGGALVEALTAPFALLADALSFLASASFLRGMRVDEPAVQRADGARLRHELAEGFRFVLGDPLIRAGLGCAATVNLFNFVFHAIFVLYATRELDLAPGLLGTALALGAAGAVVGALAAPRIARRIGIGPSVVLGSVLFPAPLVLVPLAEGPTPVVVAMLATAEFFACVGVMVFDVSLNSMNLLRTPYRIRSRTTGTYRFVNYGVRPLGALAGGFVGSAIGLRPTLWIAVLGALVGVVWLLFSPIPRLREAPEEAS